MPVLDNPKWEAFAQALAKGKPQAEAYAAAGYKKSDQHASRLASSGKVAARVAELQSKAAERALVTIESIADELEEARALAIKEGQSAAAVSASMGKAKLYGHLVDKIEVKHVYADLSDEELAAEIAAMMREMEAAAGQTTH